MPKYRISTPDGKTFEVSAPEGATKDQVLRYAQANHSSAARSNPDGPGGTFGAAVGSIVNNVLPNWGDEVAGLGRLIGAYTGSGRDPKTAFADGQREFREQQARYKQQHPTLSKATAVGGTALGLALPAGRLAEGANIATRMAHGAAVGAGYGAASGAGEGESLADRGSNAVRSGAIGATVGAALAPATSAAVAVGRRARMLPGVEPTLRAIGNVPRAVMRRPLVRPGQRAVEHADRVMADQMEQGHIQTGMGQQGPAASPEAIVAEQERRAATGVPAMPGDTTQPMRNLTSWASRGMGPGQSRVIQALDARKATEADRVRQHVVETMGPVGDPILQVEQHVRQAKDRVAPLYEEAYAQPAVVTPEMQGVMNTPAFRRSLPQAHENILNAQRDPNAMGLRLVPHTEGANLPPNVPHMVTPEGVYVLNEGLSTEGFDQVIRAMRDRSREVADVNPLTGRPIHNTNSVHIDARAHDLRSELAEQNGPYRQATESYGDDMAQRDAYVAGQDVRKLSGHEINAQRRAMPDTAPNAWSIGARTALADQASEHGAAFPTGDTARHVQKALGDPVKQQAIGEMSGNSADVRGLLDRLEGEHQGNLLWREVQGNSRTAHRQSLDADLDDAMQPLSNLSVRGVLAGVARHIGDRATSEFRNKVKDRVAQVATETNPATVRELMGEIAARAQRDRDFADLLHRSGVIGLKPYGANIAPQEN